MSAAPHCEFGYLKKNKNFPLYSKQESPIFSNISYLKQFTPDKMGAEAFILPNSLISKFFRAYPLVQWRSMKVTEDQLRSTLGLFSSSAVICQTDGCNGWMDGMVIIGHGSSKSTFDANNLMWNDAKFSQVLQKAHHYLICVKIH